MEKVIELLNRKSAKPATSYPTKILQFGEGNFLRAFIDWIVHELNGQTNFNAGVKIIQPLPQGLGDKLNEQDGLYHVLLNGYSGEEFISNRQLIDVINGVTDPYQSFDEFLKEAENPELKFIVSNTTEAGIVFDETDAFESRPAKTFPGKLLQFLYHRYQTLPDSAPLIVLPCELIDENGKKLRSILRKLADHWKLGDYFLNWMDEKTEFCNTLVDRIVPGYPKESAEELWDDIGFRDELLVEGELFHLWVIEGSEWIKEYLPTQQTNLNIVFTNTLAKYRTRKVRILNGLHTTMVPVGYLLGNRLVKETVENELMEGFLNRALHEEIIPSLLDDKNELKVYAEEIMLRFKNPAIKHELVTISLNSFSKFKTRVLPSILDLYEKEHKLAKHLLFSLASLIRFYKREWNGEEISIKDDPYVMSKMKDLWTSNKNVELIAMEVLSDEKLWDQNLNRIPGLLAIVSEQLKSIDENGVETALRNL